MPKAFEILPGHPIDMTKLRDCLNIFVETSMRAVCASDPARVRNRVSKDVQLWVKELAGWLTVNTQNGMLCHQRKMTGFRQIASNPHQNSDPRFALFCHLQNLFYTTPCRRPSNCHID